MECCGDDKKTVSSLSVCVDVNPSETSQSNLSSNSSPPAVVVVSPCAACKILRRRCAEKCVLAPYFPPSQPHKFSIAHRVFGASNIIKILQELPECQRGDAVSSMVYEATARIRDPVYGAAGTISHLQKQISDLKAELARAQAQVLSVQSQHTNLLALICMEMAPPPPPPMVEHLQLQPPSYIDTTCFLDDATWEPLWT